VVLALSSQFKFSLWFSPVPITLQVFFIFLISMIFEQRFAVGSLLVYMALGTGSLPVFAGGAGGIAYVFGPTGGYLFGFLIASRIIGLLQTRTDRWGNQLLAASLGLGALYLCGYGWLLVWLAGATGGISSATVMLAWQQGVLPFVFVDFLKIAAACSIASLLVSKKSR
ncbi:MAG TPA: biotin transporter BioY, partial [bacterium]|nr:biotin transporter BioY [bacterium]